METSYGVTRTTRIYESHGASGSAPRLHIDSIVATPRVLDPAQRLDDVLDVECD